MSCICIDELRPASYRGAAFFVASDEGQYGRRDVEHEYPMRDDGYVEDMGQKMTHFTVNGYLAGDDWVAQKNALVAACTARGPAMLQLPTETPTLANCKSLNVSRTKDACGFYSVKMEFVIAKALSVPSIIGVIESQIGAIFNSAIAPLTVLFDAAYIAADTLSYVVDNQVARVTTFAADVIAAVESAPSINPDLSTDTVQAAISIFQSADAYTQPGPGNSVYLAEQPIVAQTIGKVANDVGVTAVGSGAVTVTSGAAAIVPMIAYTINAIGNSMSPDDAVSALTTFAAWSVNESKPVGTGTAPLSPSDHADGVNGGVFCGAVRSFALMKLAQALTAKKFRTRAEAIQARANVVELFNAQIAMFEEDEIVNIMLSARDLAVRSITQKMATIVPVLTITAGQTKPSKYWAARLYNDVSRAEELFERNGVVNPAFMPATFEALAR